MRLCDRAILTANVSILKKNISKARFLSVRLKESFALLNDVFFQSRGFLFRSGVGTAPKGRSFRPRAGFAVLLHVSNKVRARRERNRTMEKIEGERETARERGGRRNKQVKEPGG